MKYEAQAGQSITSAAREAIKLAGEHSQPVEFDFNGIPIVVEAGQDPKFVSDRYMRQIQKQAEDYEKSPEGLAYAAKRSKEIAVKQNRVGILIQRLSKPLSLDEMMNWVKQFTDDADDTGVECNFKEVAKQIEALGYVANEHVGQKPEWFNNRERMGRYIVGQCLTFMNKGMGPHPVAISFVNKYFGLAY